MGLLACVVVLLATAWYVGSRFDPPAPRPAAGAVRLGPEPGEAVADYVARLPAELPAPGTPVLALVQFGAELTTEGAMALLGGAPGPDGAAPVTAAAVPVTAVPVTAVPVTAVSAVFHVPLPRVQTALRFVALDPGPPLPAALGTARERAWFAADADAARRAGRPADVAATEAAALADPACRCVLAVVVRADRAGLELLAARPGVRAVHAAPAGADPVELALSPLLPSQVERADPVPDDGPVPAAAPS